MAFSFSQGLRLNWERPGNTSRSVGSASSFVLGSEKLRLDEWSASRQAGHAADWTLALRCLRGGGDHAGYVDGLHCSGPVAAVA